MGLPKADDPIEWQLASLIQVGYSACWSGGQTLTRSLCQNAREPQNGLEHYRLTHETQAWLAFPGFHAPV